MLKKWNLRNNRLFCHIFIIGGILIGAPIWLSLCGAESRIWYFEGNLILLSDFSGSNSQVFELKNLLGQLIISGEKYKNFENLKISFIGFETSKFIFVYFEI